MRADVKFRTAIDRFIRISFAVGAFLGFATLNALVCLDPSFNPGGGNNQDAVLHFVWMDDGVDLGMVPQLPSLGERTFFSYPLIRAAP